MHCNLANKQSVYSGVCEIHYPPSISLTRTVEICNGIEQIRKLIWIVLGDPPDVTKIKMWYHRLSWGVTIITWICACETRNLHEPQASSIPYLSLSGDICKEAETYELRRLFLLALIRQGTNGTLEPRGRPGIACLFRLLVFLLASRHASSRTLK